MKILGFLALGFPLEVFAGFTSFGLKDSLLAESSERTVSFASLPFDLPNNALLSNDILTQSFKNYNLNENGRIGCTTTSTSKEDEEVSVVLAFSKCLNESALKVVEQWVNQVKSTFVRSASATDLKIKFQSTMVPGACEERSEKTKHGLEDPDMANQSGATVFLADKVEAHDLKRLEAFPDLGAVIDLAQENTTLDINPIAVISFVSGEKSYHEVQKFEASAHVSKTFNFRICKSGTNCEGEFENCIDLPEVVDLFMYNPFTVTRSLECANLDNGVPVTYLDANGARQCFCNCPAGYEMTESEYGLPTCTKVTEETCPCVWANVNGFKHQVTTDEPVCLFQDVASNWGLPVPFPTDGYVSDKRDTLTEGSKDPRITLYVDRQQDAEYKRSDIRGAVGTGTSYPLTFQEVLGLYPSASSFSPVIEHGQDKTILHEILTWREYQTNRDTHINDLTFTSYGKYHLKVSAYDYFSSATCDGCLVIVDNNRPKATTSCPLSFCDNIADPQCKDTAVLTIENLDKANALVTQYLDFAIKAKNDACSMANRCDQTSVSQRNFFEKEYTNHDSSFASQCFDKDKVLNDLLTSEKIKTNPLVQADNNCDNTIAPVPPSQCTKCCKMATSLKEWWTDYRCGSDYDVRSCDGDSDQKCHFDQCLVVNGDTMATVTASITEDAKTASEKVLAQVEEQSYQTVTQIHRALDCTSFGGTDGECDFRAKLSELIDTTETLKFTSTSSSSDYIFWRYKLVSEGESWQLWKTGKQTDYGQVSYENDDVLTFSNPETKVILEAWTQCGLVRRFFFYVHLHVNSPMSVCEKFNDMWYQTSVSRLPIGTSMCAYPGSDFAEVTFDFHPNVGLQYSREELRMNVSNVECTGALEGRLPIEILKVTQDSPEIVTRFAVEMLNKPTTEAATDFHVECAFTYTKYSGAIALETCKRDFSISDCKGPAFDTPNAVCEFEGCAGKELAGLYEACGGTIVKADEKCTIVETEDKSCCQGCETTQVTCTSLLGLPNANTDIKRCEPNTEGVYSSPSYSYGAVLLTETAQNHPAATALLSATALIAVIALVVVRHRVVTSKPAPIEEDAYYPLLH
ncbi:uncharacterized protein PHALS_10623 [Plasmopara halstedii]|uniref:Uncharacterized protein n=1 Tax=Plasmopara halstedii TaxID=4781 RepID=A0A0P1AGY1_PLAHL|nr:uncharacterized protein PHALS_10623 [Plasmopara halstedii]CEG40424.1 hypothetical protein PHALS_10623 [Plasmopara halstedii]|eukprot:XP_024576793.1 hypothetical protein PHALS_10623 [Plasmopara halstedii]